MSPRRGAGAGSHLSAIEALTTDLWYTLLYVTPGERGRIEAARRRAWTGALEAAGATRAGAIAAWRAAREWSDGRESRGYAPSVEAQVEWLARRIGRPIEPGPVARALDDVIEGADVRLAPGAVAALRRLAANGVRLGVVSNVTEESSSATAGLLDRLGLLDRFGSIQLSPELPWSKPQPGPFLRCLDELGTAPASALHLGDLPSDIVGARKAGMMAEWFTGLHRFEFPEGVPASFRALRCPTLASWSDLERRMRSTAPGGSADLSPASAEAGR